jgi:hypothetical protein
VYDDSTVWENWSWELGETLVNFKNVEPVYTGTHSIAITYTLRGWGGFSLHATSPLTPAVAGVDRLVFWAHGGQGGARYVGIYVQGPQTTSPKILKYIPAGRWTKFEILLSALGNPTQIDRFNIQNYTERPQAVFYLDQIMFTGPPPSALNLSRLQTILEERLVAPEWWRQIDFFPLRGGM